MTASNHLAAGRLGDALSAAVTEVRDHPQDSGLRTLLFELLCFAGDWDRALKHLNALAGEETERTLAIQRYRGLIEAERARNAVFAGTAAPKCTSSPPECVVQCIEALKALAAGDHSGARAQFELAEAGRAPVAGTLNGRPFQDLRDCDDRLTPFLEVMTPSGYGWVPWVTVRRIVIEPPKTLRNTIWAPATIQLECGDLDEAFIPVRYPGSERHEDENVRLARTTLWPDSPSGLAIGNGQRMLSTDADDYALLEIRELVIGGGSSDTA